MNFQKKIVYINLDDPFFIPFSNDATKFYDTLETAEKLTGEKIEYLFLDKVQAINGWERFIKSYYETIILKDCVLNNSIRDTKSFRDLSYYLLTNIASTFSYTFPCKSSKNHRCKCKRIYKFPRR